MVNNQRPCDMKLLVIFILVGQEVSGGTTVLPVAEKPNIEEIIPLNNDTQNEKPRHEQEKLQVKFSIDDVPKMGLHVTSEELFDRPKRERETDKDFLKNVIREILSYDQFKHHALRDRNDKKKGLHFGIQIRYNENESESATHEKVPTDSENEEINDELRVQGRSKAMSKQADRGKDKSTLLSSKDDITELSKYRENHDKNNQNVEEGLSNMAEALAKYLKYYNLDENDKQFGNSKESPTNKEVDMSKQNIVVKAQVSKDFVNHIISEIRLLLATHKDKSDIYFNRILDIITKKQEYSNAHRGPACGRVNVNYLIHSLNSVYQKYLKNSVCEGEYLDTGLDLIDWISSNKQNVKDKTKSNLNKSEIDSNDENETKYASTENRHQNSADPYSSGEVKMSDSSENERKNHIKYEQSPLTSDNSANLMTREFKSDEDHEDPYKEKLDLYIKSRLVRPLRSIIFRRSQPYYRNIKKIVGKQENANIVLESIHKVCEKIASEQFLNSVEAIIWRLIESRDCKPKNALKDENYKINVIKPSMEHQNKQKKSDANSQASLEGVIADLNESSYVIDINSSTHNTEFNKSSLDRKKYDNVAPLLKNNPRSKNKRFRDRTQLRHDQLRNIFGPGKINTLKVIKQKLNNLNISDYKKLMENLLTFEKLLKIIYNQLPSQLRMILTILKTGAKEIIGNKNLSITKVPSLLLKLLAKGKGKDLFKMMTDKFEHEKLIKNGRLSEKFHDKTRSRGTVQSTSVVNKEMLQEKPEPLDSLPHIELPSSVEKNDKPVIELTYVFNHPPAIHYKPKIFIKHNISYDQYLKNIKSIYNNDLVSSGNQIRLVRVAKKEGNNNQVFYETDISNTVFEARNNWSLLQLFNQFYNSADNEVKNYLREQNLNENYDTNKKEINEISRTVPSVEFHSTFSTVSPVASSKGNTEFQSRDGNLEKMKDSTFENNEFSIKDGNLEYIKDSTLENNEYSIKDDNFKSEKVYFDSERSENEDVKAQTNSYIRDGIIHWNNYTINRRKNDTQKKNSRNHRDIRQPR